MGAGQSVNTAIFDIQESKCKDFDLLKQLRRCRKNPGHGYMIPFRELRLSHLPRQYQDQDLLHCIIAAGCLTVRVDVHKYKLSRSVRLRRRIFSCFGSGKICLIKQFTHEMTVGSQYTKCPCNKCKHSVTPSETWGEIYVLTTSHVVSNSMDVKNTSCKLFYDSEESPCLDLEVVNVRTQEKFCRSWLTCATCDLMLVEKLSHMLYLFKKLYDIVYNRYHTVKTSLTFIISHPHGCSKRVSLGTTAVKKEFGFHSLLLYRIATCPGSGGAPIYLLNSWTDHIKYQHLHKMHIMINYGISCSTFAITMLETSPQYQMNELTSQEKELLQICRFSIMMTFLKMGLAQEERAHVTAPADTKSTFSDNLKCTSSEKLQSTSLDDFVSSSSNSRALMASGSDNTVGEIDLHLQMVCKKYPGHKGFIPITKFNLHCLPRNFQDKDIYDAIIGVSNLIVHISVRMISHARPDVWPDSSRPYPGNDTKGKRILRYGSGKVERISIFSEDNNIWSKNKVCTCTKCKSSSTPSLRWGEIIVATAAHVAFDNEEAKHTTCRLFYDTQDSIEVTLGPDGEMLRSNVKTDFCELKFITCNLEIIQKLKKHVHDNNKLWNKLHRKYRYIEYAPRPVFILSHPHGFSKQVSIGKEINKLKGKGEELRETSLEYDTPTCPGSSGAPVFILGYKEYMLVPYVHSGHKEGLNVSNKTIECASLEEQTERYLPYFKKFNCSSHKVSQPLNRCGKELIKVMNKVTSVTSEDFEIPDFSTLEDLAIHLIPMDEPDLD